MSAKALKDGLAKLRYCASNSGWQPFKPDEAQAILDELGRLEAGQSPARKVRAKAPAKKAPVKPAKPTRR